MSRNLDPMDAIDSIFVRLDRQLARIAALETDVERLESASGVPQEPGNATEAQNAANRQRFMTQVLDRNDAETAAALRMYQKVQTVSVVPSCGYGDHARHVKCPDGGCHDGAVGFLAWLKEGEA